MKLERLAPAKLNLGLHVLGRREDGYHEIETVMVRVPWHDRLVAEPADDWAFSCSDDGLPVDGGNLCVRAAHLLREWEGVEHGAHLHLEKRIPYGAGLGGGSSDAAATLLVLNELWELQLGVERLMELGAELGADVPFFVGDGAMIARGIGTDLEPLNVEMPLWAVVCVPGVEISTAEAYDWVEPRSRDRADLPELVQSGDLRRWRKELVNDFQEPVVRRYPAIGEVLESLDEAGAAYVSLSGSGSAVYGLFSDEERAAVCAAELVDAGRHVWHGELQW